MGSREVQISVMLAWPWHQGCAKTTAPQIIRQRESERILAVAHQSSTRKHRLTQKQTWTQTEGLRLFELVVSVRVWCMARQKERALQSYHREHSGPKPASVAWHLYPGGLPTEPPVPVTLIWREITYQVFITVHMDTVQTHLLFQFKVQKLGLGTKFLLKRSFWKVLYKSHSPLTSGFIWPNAAVLGGHRRRCFCWRWKNIFRYFSSSLLHPPPHLIFLRTVWMWIN